MQNVSCSNSAPLIPSKMYIFATEITVYVYLLMGLPFVNMIIHIFFCLIVVSCNVYLCNRGLTTATNVNAQLKSYC